MKNQWLVYVLVAVISVGAGVAVAGVPGSESTDATILVPATTEAPEPTIASTVSPTTAAPEPVVTEPEPPAETTTTTMVVETTTTQPEIDRAVVAVVALNAAGAGGIAGAARAELVDLGYLATRTDDATAFVDVTVVYYYDGAQLEAEAVAADLGLDPGAVLPVADAPSIPEQDGDQVVVYLGRDRI